MCYPFRSIFTNVLYLFLNLTIVLIIYAVCGSLSFLGILLFFIGLLLNILLMSIIGIYLAIVCARFRDIPFIISNIMQVMFFVTPVIWKIQDISERYSFLEYNPLYIFIELVRAPLIHGSIVNQHLYYAVGLICVASIGLLFVINIVKKQIAFWT